MRGVRAAIVNVVLTAVGLCGATADAQPWVVHETGTGVEIFAEAQIPTDAILTELMQVQHELDTLLNLPRTPQTVQVIVFSSQENYRNYLRRHIPEGVRRRAIFYKSGTTFQIYSFRHSDLMVDLRHEYTHALLHQSLPFVPLWIDEGLAEFMEERPEQRARSSRQSGMKWRCRTGWKPNLSNLEKIPSAAEMTADHYRDSWAWAAFLLNESAQTRNLLKQYLTAISAGEAPGSFSEWVASREPEVVNRVGSYFRRIRISLR
ncbi:MAG: hypothetical protein R3C59_12300 [Planctomycetaceae bacterium]